VLFLIFADYNVLKMKKIFLILIITTFLGCKVTEKPELIKVESVKVLQANREGIKLKTDLRFLNKNSVGGTLQANNIKVLIDSLQVATLNSEPFKVPRKKEFILPLTVVIPYEKIYKDNKQNLLSNVMNFIRNKKIRIVYKGEIRYSLGNFHYDYPLNYTDEILLK